LYFPIRYALVEPSIKIDEINSDVEVECLVVDVEKCNQCSTTGSAFVKFNFDIDGEDKNVTKSFKCKVYFEDNFEQICTIYGIELKVNTTLTCYYSATNDKLYLKSRKNIKANNVLLIIFVGFLGICFLLFCAFAGVLCMYISINNIKSIEKDNQQV